MPLRRAISSAKVAPYAAWCLSVLPISLYPLDAHWGAETRRARTEIRMIRALVTLALGEDATDGSDKTSETGVSALSHGDTPGISSRIHEQGFQLLHPRLRHSERILAPEFAIEKLERKGDAEAAGGKIAQ